MKIRAGFGHQIGSGRYGSLAAALGQTKPAVKARRVVKAGKRPDLDDLYFRSAWEANYARYLRWLCQRGVIQAWAYEPRTYVFRGVTRGVLTYTPDFEVTERDGRVIVHEVKGWMDRTSKAKLKRMAEFYPAVEIVVVDRKLYRTIEREVGALLPGWES